MLSAAERSTDSSTGGAISPSHHSEIGDRPKSPNSGKKGFHALKIVYPNDSSGPSQTSPLLLSQSRDSTNQGTDLTIINYGIIVDFLQETPGKRVKGMNLLMQIEEAGSLVTQMVGFAKA